MELVVEIDDYRVAEVLIAASVAGIKITVTKGVSHDDLVKLDAKATTLALKTTAGIITRHVAMLRYIAEMVPAAQLLGMTEFHTSQVDQWLEFSVNELEVPVCALTDSNLQKKAIADTITAMTIIEKHLSEQTYTVGERQTLADICFFAVSRKIIKTGLIDIRSKFPSVFRLYMTVGSQKLVIAAAGALPSPIPLPASAAVSTLVDAGTFPGKWQRNRIRVKELLAKDVTMIGKVCIWRYTYSCMF
jgi:glutathione S-transferase